ncbi:hypothetical protein HY500_00310 [Candidatus Woesearchaeota archaeon]|nr:hypothetical protein [Candidatus Woesearchaeota archaeon]
MLYSEYRLDFNGKRAILSSQDRLVRCISLDTGDKTKFTSTEEIVVIFSFMAMELYERRGISMGDHITIRQHDFPIERAEYMISELQRVHGLKPPILEKRVELEGFTTFPEDWYRLSIREFNELMNRWIRGEL